VGSLVVELNSAQGQPTGVNREWVQRIARESGFKRCKTIHRIRWSGIAVTGASALPSLSDSVRHRVRRESSKGVQGCGIEDLSGRATSRGDSPGFEPREIGEVELERIVLAKIRRISAIFKAVIEDAKSAAYHQFWTHLVGKAHARSKIGLLGFPESCAVMVRDVHKDAVLRHQGGEARRNLRRERSGWQEVCRMAIKIRHKVRLFPVVLVNETKEIIAHAEIHGQFGRNLPIVIEVAAVVILAVVGQGNIGDVHPIRPADVIYAVLVLICLRNQQEVRNAYVS